MGSKVIRNVTKILKATSGRLFGRVTSGTGRAEELTPAEARTVLELGTLATQSGTFSGTSSGTNTGDQNLFGTIVVAGQSDVVADATGDTLTLVAGTNISITTNAGSDSITINNTASGLSGTGSVDNAVLRADGTGGATLQNSAFVIADNATASPNNTVNHACLEATGSTTNVSVSIKPKGTGAFLLSVPDGTAAGGNVRGANAVDLQRNRFAAADVASGSESFIGSGIGNRASGLYAAIPGGSSNVVSGQSGCAVNEQHNITARAGFAANGGHTVAGACGTAFGTYGSADRAGMFVVAGGRFGANGDGQFVRRVAGIRTTDATPATLRTATINSGEGGGDYNAASALRLTIPAGKIFAFTARITGIKSDGTAVAEYVRKGVIKRIVNTTSLVGTIETIGTDIEDNASTDVAITADDTNEALDISVTGIAGETWRWVAVVEGVEIAYGA
jgi:hypothetical protein